MEKLTGSRTSWKEGFKAKKYIIEEYRSRGRSIKLDLKEGEERCPLCCGLGTDHETHWPFATKCYLCKGTRKVDWVKYARYTNNEI